jgi:DNA polymerase III subunit delta
VSRRPRKTAPEFGFDELRIEVEAGRINPLYLFIGEEHFLQSRAIQLLQDTIDESLRVFNLTILTIGTDSGGSKITAATAVDIANQMPMMVARRIVVVREFEKIKEDEQSIVLGYLKRPSPTTTMIFQAAAPDKRRKLTAELVKNCTVVSFDLLDESRAGRWVKERLKESGSSIDSDALRLLLGLVGTGLTRLSNEINKLAAFSGGASINAATVQQLVARSSEHSSWEIWDAINVRDRKRALKLMERLLNDTDALPILGSLASLYRRLLTGKELLEAGASQQEITRATGQWSQTFLNRLQRTPRAEFVHGLKRIAEVDNAIKNSEGTPRLQMQFLIAELTSN